MNEVATLSNDLTTITAEINSYKQLAGQSIFEIGRRLNHVKENDLVHGQFQSWLEQTGLDIRTAQRMMKIASDNSLNTTTLSHLGTTALYEISTMSEEERTKEHVVPSTGESKTPDDMTVRELREVKKQLRNMEQAKQEAEQQAEAARQSERIATSQLAEMENREPEVVEKVVEKMPPDKEHELRMYKGSYEDAIARNKELELKRADKDSYEESQREHERMTLEASNESLELLLHIDDFLEKASVTAFRQGAIARSSESTKQRLSESVETLENYTREIKLALNGRIKT